jgi:hypothetical protein
MVNAEDDSSNSFEASTLRTVSSEHSRVLQNTPIFSNLHKKHSRSTAEASRSTAEAQQKHSRSTEEAQKKHRRSTEEAQKQHRSSTEAASTEVMTCI